MFKYYCPECKKLCDFYEDIELLTINYEGDYREVHDECGTQVIVTI